MLTAAVLRRLRVLLGGGRRLVPGIPHRYAPEAAWPGRCWCDRVKLHRVHLTSTGVPL